MNIAILGFGVVGKGVYDILEKLDIGIEVRYIFERDMTKVIGLESKVTTDINTILNDNSIDIVIELMGGLVYAYEVIKKCLQVNKHVVSANKAVISSHMRELTNLAKIHNVQLRYEASVGGGIVVLNPLNTISKLNHINHIKGIINGTTNFVLTKFFKSNLSLEKSLNLAMEMGYLETGSTDDMDGLDLMRKINILSSISYHQFIDEKHVFVNKLSDVSSEMLEYVKDQGFLIKYVGESWLSNNEVMIRVEPVIIDKTDIYSAIDYGENYIEFNGENFEQCAFQGLGAGRYPTAQAVVYDLFKIKSNILEDALINREDLIINNDLLQFNYLILDKNNKIYKTDKISLSELLRLRSNCICYIRIEADINV